MLRPKLHSMNAVLTFAQHSVIVQLSAESRLLLMC